MEFITPMTGIVAAAVAVPALLLLYFLKLKRHEQMVSCTLLWKRAVQDLQVNAPFQRLKANILLFLQLLALLLILLALARPALKMNTEPGKRFVLLIDRSASMNTVEEGGRTRLELAKQRARQFAEGLQSKASLSLTDKSDQAMIMAFGSRAKVLCNFTSDKRKLLAAIDAIEPTDGTSTLAEAVRVTQAFLGEGGEASGSARVELFTDGRIRDLEAVSIPPAEVTYHRIGAADSNLGIGGVKARRSYETPEKVTVFTTLLNYGTEQLSCDVQLAVGETVRSVQNVTVGPCTRTESADPSAPGEKREPGRVAVTFELTQPDAGVLTVRHLRDDALAADNAAWAILPPPQRLRALLVTPGNFPLRNALDSCPLAGLKQVTGAEFDAMDPARLESENGYDVIILDRHVPAILPRARYIVFGPPPKQLGIPVKREIDGAAVIDWRSRHPVLQHVPLSRLYAAEHYHLQLPREGQVLAEFDDGPAMALLQTRGSAFVLVAFDVLETNWPFEHGFVMFCYNAVSYLGTAIGPSRKRHLQVGEGLLVQGAPGGGTARIIGPGVDQIVQPDPSGAYRFAGTRRAGVYQVSMPDHEPETFALNIGSAAESNVKPAEEVVLLGEPVTAVSGPPTHRAGVELWPLLAGLALLVVCIEWFVYNRKVKL